jgi:hypothetical protein
MRLNPAEVPEHEDLRGRFGILGRHAEALKDAPAKSGEPLSPDGLVF